MRMREQRLWDAFKKSAQGAKNLWLQRMENVCVPGMADVVVIAHGGATSWVELKSAVVPKRATTPLLGRGGLSLAQRNWHLKAASMNARTYILVRAGREFLLVRGVHAASINEWPLEKLRFIACALDMETALKELGE